MVSDVKSLSSVLLEMKFMKRTKLRIEEEERRKQEERLKTSFLSRTARPGPPITLIGKRKVEKSSLDEPSSSKKPRFVFDKPLSEIEDLTFGRMSFGGFSPEIEKLMKYHEDLKNGLVPEEEVLLPEADIDDQDMAFALGSASSAVAKKFSTKKQRAIKNMEKKERTFIDEICMEGARKRRSLQKSDKFAPR